MTEYTLFSGTANPELATSIAGELGMRLGARAVERFPDGEIYVRLDETVRGHEVFVVQPTSRPVNDHLVELLTFVDACRRAAAARVTAIIPYLGYSRADSRHGHREAISASMVVGLLQWVGTDQLVVLDLHTPQLEGFFRGPMATLTAVPILCEAVRDRLPADVVVVSPDAGRVRMATAYAQRLHAPLIIIHKRRANAQETAVGQMVGDPRGRACLIVDDMISTGGTVVETVVALRAAGARDHFVVAATHGLLLDGARDRLLGAGVHSIYTTDTVAPPCEPWPQLVVVSVAPLLASALRRLMASRSLADLF